MKEGVFTTTIRNSSVEVIKPYVDAFVRAMRRDGCNFILNVREEDLAKQENEPAGEIKGETVNRKRLLTKAILLEYSIKDASNQD